MNSYQYTHHDFWDYGIALIGLDSDSNLRKESTFNICTLAFIILSKLNTEIASSYTLLANGFSTNLSWFRAFVAIINKKILPGYLRQD